MQFFVLQSLSDKVLINWEDDHKSVYDSEWLKSRSFAQERQKEYLKDIYKPPYKYWDKEDFKNICHKYDYNEVITRYE